jgi:ACS family hexuronate transporter-like MFS transporter
MQQAIGKYRWVICGLIFLATSINYLDRAVLSLLKPVLTAEFNWNETSYSNIVVAFQICYAIGLLGAGRLIDKLGTKTGYAVTTGFWSIVAMAHAAVCSTFGFFIARAALGLSEAGNFPAAIKTIAEWFPKKERAFATGIFNSGSNAGAIIAPLTVPFIAVHWGWQWAFIITGFTGIIWLILWLVIYQVPALHKSLSRGEYDYINSDNEQSISPTFGQIQLSWPALLIYKETWAFAIGKFLTDPIWWFYLFWLPDFLQKQYGLSGTQVALPVALAYTMAAGGSIFGGWLPLNFIKNGWTVFQSRRVAMLIYACCALPVVLAQYLGSINLWFAVTAIGVAMAAHQAWSANIYTTVSDFFPKAATASVTGIGSMFGACGGILIAALAGRLFDYYHSTRHIQTGYFIMFLICSTAYLIAWIIMRILVPGTGKINT